MSMMAGMGCASTDEVQIILDTELLVLWWLTWNTLKTRMNGLEFIFVISKIWLCEGLKIFSKLPSLPVQASLEKVKDT